MFCTGISTHCCNASPVLADTFPKLFRAFFFCEESSASATVLEKPIARIYSAHQTFIVRCFTRKNSARQCVKELKQYNTIVYMKNAWSIEIKKHKMYMQFNCFAKCTQIELILFTLKLVSLVDLMCEK